MPCRVCWQGWPCHITSKFTIHPLHYLFVCTHNDGYGVIIGQSNFLYIVSFGLVAELGSLHGDIDTNSHASLGPRSQA